MTNGFRPVPVSDLVRDLNLPDRLIVFDNLCTLCAGWVQFVCRFDPVTRCHFLAAQSEKGQSIMAACGLDGEDFDSNVLIMDGVAYFKMDTVTQTLSSFGGLWACCQVINLLPRTIRNGLYDLIARHRYRLFGKMDVCYTPNPHIRARFIDK